MTWFFIKLAKLLLKGPGYENIVHLKLIQRYKIIILKNLIPAPIKLLPITRSNQAANNLVIALTLLTMLAKNLLCLMLDRNSSIHSISLIKNITLIVIKLMSNPKLGDDLPFPEFDAEELVEDK